MKINTSIISTCAILCATFFTLNFANAQTISTVAGTGSGSFSGDGGLATVATINRPLEIHTDALGNIFIVDSDNHRIRKIDAGTGIITTVIGTGSLGFSGDGGQATAASINSPTAVCIDPNGNIYFSDKGNQRIRKVDISTGIITTIAGNGSASFSGDGGPSTAATLSQPHGMQTDNAGNLFFCDRTNHRVRRIDALSGIISTIAGTGTIGYSGDGGAGTSANMSYPIGIAVDNIGNVYVADQINHRIRVIDTAGVINTVAGAGTPGFSGDGSAALSAQLNQPYDVGIDANGDLYISDTNNQRIRKIVTATGVISTHGGNGTSGYGGDGGPATAAMMSFPSGIAVDAAGNTYIGDKLNHRVRKINSCSTNSTLNVTQCNAYTTPSGNNTYTVSGTYTDILQNAANCDSVIIINLAIPVVDTSVSTGAMSLTSNATSANYQWLDCNNGFAIIAGETSQTYTATSNGNFAVEVTNNSCTDTSACYMITFTSIGDPLNKKILVYPNPAKDIIFIESTGIEIKQITIYDIFGNLIYTEDNEHLYHQINTSYLNQGMYFLKIIGDHAVLNRSFVKQ